MYRIVRDGRSLRVLTPDAEYVTEAVIDSGTTGSYDTVGVKFTTDGGANWSPLAAAVDPNEFANGTNHNEYPSLAIEPDGSIVEAWHRGMCCGGPSPINSPNKVMWARSTDGGVSFPVSGTIFTVALNQTVPFNATSPGALSTYNSRGWVTTVTTSWWFPLV